MPKDFQIGCVNVKHLNELYEDVVRQSLTKSGVMIITHYTVFDYFLPVSG